MQDDPEGRKTQVPKRWAAEKIAAELGGGPITKDTVAAAERFLADPFSQAFNPGKLAMAVRGGGIIVGVDIGDMDKGSNVRLII